MMAAWFESLLGIPAAQQRRTALLFCYAFCMSGAYVSSRADADAVFLTRAGIDRLPAMILVSATAVTLAAATYAQAVQRFRLQTVILVFHLLQAIATTSMTGLLKSHGESVAIPAGLYLLAELRGALGSIHFSTLLNELFHSSAPARVTGVAGAGSTLSGIVLGALTGVLADDVGVSSLLFTVPLLDMVAGLIAVRCRDDRDAMTGASVDADVNPAAGHEPRDKPASWREILAHPLARYLAVIVAMKSVVVVLLEYEWKRVATEELIDEAALAGFFGEFYAMVFLLTGVVQLLGTSRVLTGLGLRAALASFPLCVATVLLTMVVPGSHTLAFRGLTIARGSDVLRRSLTDPALNLLYWPLAPRLRRQTIAFIGGWVKPLVEATGALLLIPLSAHLSLSELSVLIAIVCAIWLIVIFRGRLSARPGH